MSDVTTEKEVCVTAIRAGRFDLRMTDHQIDRLCAKKQIGCGTYACAYTTRDPRLVVKFTADPEDVSAFLAVGKKSKRVARLHHAWLVSPAVGVDLTGAAYTARNPRHDRPAIYALEIEKVDPLSFEEREGLNNVLEANDLFTMFNEVAKDPDFGKKSFSRASYRQTAAAQCKREVQVRPRTALPVDACTSLLDQTIQIHEDLARRGVAFTDAHGGNVGWKQGSAGPMLVALDLGVSGVPLDPKKVRALRGLSRALGKRLKVLRARQRSRAST